MELIRNHKVLTALGGVVALLVILGVIGANTHPQPTASSSTPSSTATQASPSSTPSPSLSNRTTFTYSSAQQLVAALRRGGLPCTGGNYSTPVVSGATSETLCDLSSSERTLIEVFSATFS